MTLRSKVLAIALAPAMALPIAVSLTPSVAHATDLPPGHGVETPSGSRFTTTLKNPADEDDYVFDGFAGQRVTALVSIPRDSSLLATVQFVRPDGSIVPSDAPGLNTRARRRVVRSVFTLDATGRWKVRVISTNASFSDYTVTVRYRLPRGVRERNASPSDGNFTFSVPAIGGATIRTALTFRGSAPAFVSFKDPLGNDVAGYEAALLPPRRGRFFSRRFTIPDGHPLGDFPLVFEDSGASRVSFRATVRPPRSAVKRRIATLSGNEPLLESISTNVGGPGTVIVAVVQNAIDENDVDGGARMFLGPLALESIVPGEPVIQPQIFPGTLNKYSVVGRVPNSIFGNPLTPVGGKLDLIIETATGQRVVALDAFEHVAPPSVQSITPSRGTSAGGFLVTITGQGFREATSMRILIEGGVVPQQILETTPTSVSFLAPPRSPGQVRFGIQDADSQLSASLPFGTFEYLATPGINRITPGLVSVLGGETINIRGAFFTESDRVFIEETEGGETFQEVSLGDETFVNDELHQFLAPLRTKGTYEIYIQDTQGVRTAGRFTISYFQYADFSANTGLQMPPGSDKYDGNTTAVADYNNDGHDDLFIGRDGNAGPVANTSHLRVFENNGDGSFTDVTDDVMPSTDGGDDWRAHRIRVIDVTEDGFVDIVLTTNDLAVPGSNASATRILRSTSASIGGDLSDRKFENATDDLFAPLRRSSVIFGTGGGIEDNWRGLDVWVGDLDAGPGPPEIIITHDELKEETNVSCGNYCGSPTGSGAAYSFYWGGSRAFKFDKGANGGKGRYKFDFAFFPRQQGLLVPIANPPPGAVIITCNPTTPCRGKFTPFIGQRLEVGFVDLDAKPDIAVLSNSQVNAFGARTSSLQVALNKPDPDTFDVITDVTPEIFNLGGETRADTVAIGQPGYPDGTSRGVIATSVRTAAAGAQKVLRLYQYKQGATGEDDFEDITFLTTPPATATDSYQASAIEFLDIDEDGDQDMVLLANTTPGGPGSGNPGLRILRNIVFNNQVGILEEELRGLLTPLLGPSEDLAGDVLSLGDVNSDGAIDFFITRATAVGLEGQTRVIITDK